MTTSNPKIRRRRNQIMDRIKRDGVVRVSQLSQELGTTVVTIRHDLDALEQEGYLERVQGGAILPEFSLQTMDFYQRKQLNRDSKDQIAVTAAALVNDGDTLFINAGSTTHTFAQQLKHYKNLSIVTNSLFVAEELGRIASHRVILLGGNINSQFAFTGGDDAINQLRRYRADHAILSVDGVGADGRITTYHSDEAAVCRQMMERANSTIVTADHTKIGKEGFTFISDGRQMNTLVTDSMADPTIIRQLQEAVIRILMTPPQED